MKGSDDTLDLFVGLSAVLTGFAEIDLVSTSLGQVYLTQFNTRVSPGVFSMVFETWQQIAASYPTLDEREQQVGAQMWSNPQMAPALQSLTMLWYVGAWFVDAKDTTGTLVSGAAYEQGLVWPAIGTKPLGARPTGYGSWGLAPTPPVLPTKGGAR